MVEDFAMNCPLVPTTLRRLLQRIPQCLEVVTVIVLLAGDTLPAASFA